ncbi:MAG: c-type cytochrome [Verrucomicrobia bacterium]|nr:c-type cytochrome [Verrucomicrobiota bacterium]
MKLPVWRLLGCICFLLSNFSAHAAGRQLTGVYTPAQTPALSPAEAQKKFSVPEGFEMRLFAAEPDVVNPVGMTWDERGRLWVVELYEYPLGAPRGQKPRDNVKVLEDTNGDGLADKVTVFADGLDLATGILLGNGGVYVGQAPHLLFLEDTDGNDVADRRTVLMTGFGLEDRHELLNGFTWGPDGWLYMTHGVFTHSKVTDPERPNQSPVVLTAGVGRFHPRTKRFEVFAEGTSNPWGVDFDKSGNAFVSACVIDHLFHIAPGGLYVRQAGTPPNPFAYELIPSIVDHRHFRAAYAGIQIYEGDQYPEEYRGTILMGNIHDSAVHQDRLTPSGSSFKASFMKDFVRANDGWFRPVSLQVGPDGALWIMDWYDKYPCYQNANADPDGVDRAHGRIWRAVYTGGEPGKAVPPRPQGLDLGSASSVQLVKTLAHRNVWHRRMAQRLLSERRDAESKAPLLNLVRNDSSLDARLAALWTLHGAGLLDNEILDALVADREAVIRTWVARLSGERRESSARVMKRLRTLGSDSDNSVRLAVATAIRQFTSGSLTVNTPSAGLEDEDSVGSVLSAIVKHPGSSDDPLIPFMVWMAAEPLIGQDPAPVFEWLLENGTETMPLSGRIAHKTMRRVCDTQSAANLDAGLEFILAVSEKSDSLALAALEGLVDGQKGKALVPRTSPAAFVAALSKSANPEVASRARQLGTLWGDAAALNATLLVIENRGADLDSRLRAIQSVRQQKIDAVRDALMRILAPGTPDPIVQAALRALGEIGGDALPDQILKRWKEFAPASQNVASEVLISRRPWMRAFITGLEDKIVSAADLPVTVVRSLVESNDDYARNRALKVIGRFRDFDADKLKVLAEKRKVVLEGNADLVAGREIARKTCYNCHKLYGEGAEVGPDLTGVGRSTLGALLANVIDPNQLIGKGYENVEVETKDGRSVSGRVVEDTETRIRLLAAGPKEETIAKADIESMRVTELSVMPEGLEQMPDEDFRNLIWFLLNPPEDKRPMTPALRQQLIGDYNSASIIKSSGDGESVALWNPEWRVVCPDFEGAPRKLTEYFGRENVLMTHPIDRQIGSGLERVVDVPAGKKTQLTFYVAADERGDWELRVVADGTLVKKDIVDRNGPRWKKVSVDLSAFSGKKAKIRLENCANDWNYEFGYWSDIRLQVADL